MPIRPGHFRIWYLCMILSRLPVLQRNIGTSTLIDNPRQLGACPERVAPQVLKQLSRRAGPPFSPRIPLGRRRCAEADIFVGWGSFHTPYKRGPKLLLRPAV